MARLLRVRPVLPAAALVAVVLFPAPGSAQTTDEVVSRIDSLLPLWERAREETRITDSIRKERRIRANMVSTDTIPVGPLRIVTLPEQRALARSIFVEAWSRFRTPVGDDLPGVSRHLFVFQRSADPELIHVEREPKLVHRIEMWFPRPVMETAARRMVGRVVARELPETIARWIGRGNPGDPRNPGRIYRELATDSSRAARRCFGGGAASCWHAAGAVGGVERASLSDFARLDLFLHALRVGGDGAVARLVAAADGGVRAALVSAAGVPADTLVARWRERIMAARPRRGEIPGRTRGSTLAWIAFFSFLATRSTRWRSG